MKPAEEYILHQQEPYKSILLQLQIVIESSFPIAELHFKWNIPFYSFESKPLCYLNHPKNKKYVDVGFWPSVASTKYHELLISENRKVVKSLRYFKTEDIDENVLVTVLKESIEENKPQFFIKK